MKRMDIFDRERKNADRHALLRYLCTVIIENKTVDKIAPINEAQLLTYLKLTNLKLGFLLNWNVPLMKDGIKQMVNRLKD